MKNTSANRRRRLLLLALACACAPALRAAPLLRDFALRGRIEGENIRFELELACENLARGESVELLRGAIALVEARLPARTELRREGDVFLLARTGGLGGGKGRVGLVFDAPAVAEGDWRRAGFVLPVLPVRRVVVAADRPGLEMRFPTGRGLRREVAADGRETVAVHLGLDPRFDVLWKPGIRRVEAELVATCDIGTIVTAAPGTLRFDSLFTYLIAQGRTSELILALPDVNVMRVSGADIQDWRVDRGDPAAPLLRVTLGRPQQGEYALRVEYERPLPAFPCTLDLPVLAPCGVIRAGGRLLLGTDSALKLQVVASGGLTQIDQSAFASPAPPAGDSPCPVPARVLFTYQYAALPYTLRLSVDHVVPSLGGEIDLLVGIAEGQIALDARIRLDVRDAPAREVKILVDADPRWLLTGVGGAQVVDTDIDVRAVAGGREITVPFRRPLEGQALVELRLEMPLGPARDGFAVPAVTLPGARVQRGCVVAAAEHGIRLVPREVVELRDVHTASAPFRVEGAQLAYRFREPGWRLELGLEWARSAIHAEIFHLLSLGEGVVYVSAAVNCHISGAPVQTLAFRVPGAGENLEIVGAGIDHWTRSNDVCHVKLAGRAMGDATLLIAYDQPLGYDGAELQAGGIEALDTASEMGFIAVAAFAGLRVEEAAPLPPSLIRIPRDELPAGYAATVTAPLPAVFKYTRRPHVAALRVTALERQRPIGQVVDYLALVSRIGRDGEAVTRATCHVKNATRQYLEARLPPGANLWGVRQGLDDDARDLPAQQDGERLLIPVERPRDPNRSVPIEIVYAQPALPRRALLPVVRLAAPLLRDTPVTFARWEVTATDNRAIGRTGGNMTPEQGRTPLFPRWASPCRRTQTASFHRAVNLAGAEGLTVTVELLPRLLAGGSPRLLAGAALAGLAVLATACIRRRRWLFALALALLAFAAAQTGPGLATVFCAAAAGTCAALVAAMLRLLRRWRRGLREWRLRRAKRRRRRGRPAPAGGRKAPIPPPLTPETAPAADASPSPPSAPSAPESGAASTACLTLLCAAALVLAGARHLLAAPPDTAGLPAPLFVERLDVEIDAPAPGSEAEPVAETRWRLRFRVAEPGRRLLFPASTVIAAFDAKSSRLRLTACPGGTLIEIPRAGAHEATLTTREAVGERNGVWTMTLPWPSNLFNRLTLAIPAPEMDVRVGQAAGISRTEAGGVTHVTATIAPAGRVELSWQPRPRDPRKEAPVAYAEVDTLACLRPGVIEMQTRATFNVAQGETREFALTAPEGMTVTAVAAPGLATWRFDPAERGLLAVLARPVSGTITVALTMQAPCGGLPYEQVLGAPAAGGVRHQRGRIAVATPEELLARIGETAGVAAIDTDDFDPAPFLAPEAVAAAVLRRAFRYDDPAAVGIAVRAEEVQPEMRVREAGAFSIGDERDIFSSALEVSVAKAGVFALRLVLPEGYEIETLTGRDVSHWDDSRREEQAVEVFLNRRVQDATTVNLVLSRQQRGIPPLIAVPRVQVQGAARHTGRIAVSAERGVKLAAEQLEAAVARRAGESGAPAGTLHFDILRPGWQVVLRAEVLAPVLKPEMLHRVELTEGMLRHRVHLRYRIENAGVKFFRLRVPAAEAPLTVSGRNIAGVRPLDEAGGPAAPDAAGRVWEIELHGKVENDFAMVCQYQEPYDAAGGEVAVRAVEPLGVARQSAFLAVTGGGQVQIEPRGVPAGLKPEDARALPAGLGAGDIAGALLCYRLLRPDCRLVLSVVRHAAAAVLPAQVEQVRLATILSGGGQMLTQAVIDLRPGSLRFLRLVLPSPSGTLWAALVDGIDAPVSRESGDGTETLNVALEGTAPDRRASVTLVYAETLPGGALEGRHELRAPRFVDLPLHDIRWRIFVPPEFRWRRRGGDLDIELAAAISRSFGKEAYESAVQQARETSLAAARDNLQVIDNLLQAGRRQEARNILQQAVNLSQGEQSLNEDARVQLRNVMRQQVKMGLVNRRQALRAEQNIYDERALPPPAGWNEGDFDDRYARRIEEQLDAADRENLERVADKIVEQQAQAAPPATAIRVTMPEHGREYRLRRALLNERGGTLRLLFEARRHPAAWRLALACLPLVPLFLGIWLLLRLAFGRPRP
jgi:hypothetical protein